MSYRNRLRTLRYPALAAGALVVALAGGACTGQFGGRAQAPLPANGAAGGLAPAPVEAPLPVRPGTDPGAIQAPPTSIAKGGAKGGAKGAAKAPAAPARPAPVLADGRYPALLRGVDPDHGKIAVDIVQVLHGKAARTAAAAAGEPDAEFFESWILNQNTRMRIVPMATDGRITGPFPTEYCGIDERRASLRRLAGELERRPELGRSPYVFWLTVKGGTVRVLDVELVMLRPAC